MWPAPCGRKEQVGERPRRMMVWKAEQQGKVESKGWAEPDHAGLIGHAGFLSWEERELLEGFKQGAAKIRF